MYLSRQRTKVLAAALLLISFSIGNAATIKYDATNIVANTWQYDFVIENDSLGSDIEEFTIYFDLDFYENLNNPVAPTDWDPIVIQPDPGIPDNGFYDALVLTSGSAISPNASLTGFSVEFDYLGSGTPGSQFFEIVDPNTFNVLEEGFTQPSSQVPLPAATWLLVSGMLGLGFAARAKPF